MTDIGKNLGIGIDTGGTFTDSIIINLDSKKLISKAKALTTKKDLRIGIKNSLAKLEKDRFSDVRLVALSTTLATNSVVEDKGSRVGLIITAPNPATFKIPTCIPVDEFAVIAGAHDKKGAESAPLDLLTAEKVINSMKGKVDAVAISAYFSIYNSKHEAMLKKLVSSITNLPIICGHELSGDVGMIERATTAALNGKLLPVIGELLDAVTEILSQNRIHAPLMVVKGDGSLMSEKVAREKPVETVLSGPAASMVGACWLTGIEDAIVADMGGTTTDIGIVTASQALASDSGATIGGWQTRVKAVGMWTVGLGGDSRITVNSARKIQIGPRRAIPLCAAVDDFPMLHDVLKKFGSAAGGKLKYMDMDLFTIIRKPKYPLAKHESAMFDALAGRVLHRDQIANEIGPFVDVEKFVELGFIAEISFTPTDLLHVMGELDIWDKAISAEALVFLTHKSGMNKDTFIRTCFDEIIESLKHNIAAKAMLETPATESQLSAPHLQLLKDILRLNGKGILSAHFRINRPIIAVGAPVNSYFPRVADELGTTLVIPKHAEVANAIGAITGRVIARTEARILPDEASGFIVVTPEKHASFMDFEKAVKYAEERARHVAEASVSECGGSDIETIIARHEQTAPLASGWGDSVFIEMKISATAIGKPAL